MKLYLGRPSEQNPSRDWVREREGGENFAKFPKVMQTFFTYIDFFSGPLFLACLPDREGMRNGGGWGVVASHTYSGLVSAHLLWQAQIGCYQNYILFCIISSSGAQVVPAFQRGYVAGRANSMRHEYHVSQRLVGVLVEQEEGGIGTTSVTGTPWEREEGSDAAIHSKAETAFVLCTTRST